MITRGTHHLHTESAVGVAMGCDSWSVAHREDKVSPSDGIDDFSAEESPAISTCENSSEHPDAFLARLAHEYWEKLRHARLDYEALWLEEGTEK